MQTARLELHVLRSGDHGSCVLVRDSLTDAALCIDCGISGQTFAESCGKIGVSPFKISAFLITHGHGNQVKGLKSTLTWLAKRGVTPEVYVEPGVRNATPSLQEEGLTAMWRDFRTKEPFSVGSILVRPFRTFHNNEDKGGCYNFRFEAGDDEGRDAVAVLSDAGILSREAQSELGGARVLAVEANYAPELLEQAALENSAVRFAVDTRGNFSNAQAAAVVKAFAWPGLTDVVAMYLSRQYNTSEYACAALRQALDECGVAARVVCSSADDVVSVVAGDPAEAVPNVDPGDVSDILDPDEMVLRETALDHGYADIRCLYSAWTASGRLPDGLGLDDVRKAFEDAGLVSRIDGLPMQVALDLGAVAIYEVRDDGEGPVPSCSTAFPASCHDTLRSLLSFEEDDDARF